ncbi:MAG: TolC family protein [Acidobacteriota bacterium]|nr:TolC family protein [Acidobacteriota bacterium]
MARHSSSGLRIIILFCIVLVVLMAGCAMQKYRPVPVAPAATAAALESRSLDDNGLKSFIVQALGHSIAWPPKQWDLRLLTLAAFYFNPELETARDQVAVAQAAIVTAGMRPNPTLSVSPGIPSPYLFDLGFAIPVVTAGKRKYQIEAAKNLSEAARLNVAQVVWNVRSGVRAALLNVQVAERSQNLWRAEEQLQSERVTRLAAQLVAGAIARPVVDSARVDLLNSQLATRAAEGRAVQAKAALAAAIGIPVSGLQNARFDWPEFDQLPPPASLSAMQIQRAAVLNRLDVRQALAQYSAAEAALQFQIAQQHPNFQIGPGYQFEEGHSFFLPTLSVTLPVFNRNQGPIAEAEARRKQAADNLRATQARVIAESEQALAQYRTSYAQLHDAQQALANLRHVQEPMSRQQVAAGETDWLSLNTVLLQGSAAAQAWLNTLFQTQAALGTLESAIQKPLEPEDEAPLVLPTPETLAPRKEERK